MFPFAACALNVAELLIVHLRLRLPSPLVCPCCGTGYSLLELKKPIRPRPELKGFAEMLSDPIVAHTGYKGPLPEAFCMVFSRGILQLERTWKARLASNPHTNLLEFGMALEETSRQMMLLLGQSPMLLDIYEYDIQQPSAWSWTFSS